VPLRRRGAQARRHPHRRASLPATLDAGDARFERLVQDALDGLPRGIQKLLENVAIVIDQWPVSGEDVYGLYEGVPAVEWGADWAAVANKITLFRGPLEEDFPDPAQLTEEVRRTILHELAHHAGFDDARMHELDLE
jgi:predicted Zn-dependent protease with MMP-like domain